MTITITKFQRGEAFGRPCWTANVTADGVTFPVHDAFGAWEGQRRARPGSRTWVRFHPPVPVCLALSAKAKRLEKREAVAA